MRDLIHAATNYLTARATYFAARAATHRERVEITAWAQGYKEGRADERSFQEEAQKRA